MGRLLAILSGLLGVLIVPLALAAATSWLAVLAHLLLAATCTTLSVWHGAAGRPAEARGWGLWFVLVTVAAGLSLHVGSWQRDGWGWAVPLVLLCLWGWIPPVIAWVAGAAGTSRRWSRSRRAVGRRRAAA